jgi:hypothetical protein
MKRDTYTVVKQKQLTETKLLTLKQSAYFFKLVLIY